MSEKLLQQIFKKVYGKPSWLVRRRFGPSVLMEFGKPKNQVLEKIRQATKKGIKFPKRIVKVYGDWHLTTFDCDWEIRQNNYKICNSRSKTEAIDQGCDILDGQILTKVIIHPKTFITDFYFDLGAHIQTKPSKNEDEPSSMWDLFCPNGLVFSLKSDGNYSYHSGKTPGDKVPCKPFTFDLG
jgi:hypothetical protein